MTKSSFTSPPTRPIRRTARISVKPFCSYQTINLSSSSSDEFSSPIKNEHFLNLASQTSSPINPRELTTPPPTTTPVEPTPPSAPTQPSPLHHLSRCWKSPTYRSRMLFYFLVCFYFLEVGGWHLLSCPLTFKSQTFYLKWILLTCFVVFTYMSCACGGSHFSFCVVNK